VDENAEAESDRVQRVLCSEWEATRREQRPENCPFCVLGSCGLATLLPAADSPRAVVGSHGWA
jgi:hypothetical protein